MKKIQGITLLMGHYIINFNFEWDRRIVVDFFTKCIRPTNIGYCSLNTINGRKIKRLLFAISKADFIAQK